MSCGSSNAAGQLAQQQQQQQAWTNQANQQIQNAFAGYTPQFYKGVGTAYTNWALPQVGQQYRTTRNQLLDKFAGQGILNSSASQQAQNALGASLNSAEQQVGNQALTQEQQLQQQVGNAEQSLFGQAESTANPGQLGEEALQQASNFGAPSTFAPLGQLFTSFGNEWLNQQNASLYNALASQYLNTLSNPAMFGPSSLGSTFPALGV